MYDVSLIYANAGPAGSEVEVAFGEAKVAGTLATTGSPERDATVSLGRLYVADTTQHGERGGHELEDRDTLARVRGAVADAG